MTCILGCDRAITITIDMYADVVLLGVLTKLRPIREIESIVHSHRLVCSMMQPFNTNGSLTSI